MKNPVTVDDIDDLLPQTQCGLCEYSGCRPYATAILLEGVPINRCPPGGIETLLALAEQLSVDPTPFLNDMTAKTKPPSVAYIREEECIGCTKCIQACPTDAILGASKQMHTVITDACTGCELCVAPCPVDCIDMIPTAPPSKEQQQQQAKTWRLRYQERNARLTKAKETKVKEAVLPPPTVDSRKLAIEAAVLRAKNKKNSP